MMYWDDGSSWIWMMLMPVLWIVLIGVVVWAVVRVTQQLSVGGGGDLGGHEPNETPEEIVDRRFASGEIDADTYSAAREGLAKHRARQRR